MPSRPLDAHKYRLGRVLVVAGSDRFVGAACLGSEAAARAGAGLVGVVSTEAVKQVLATRLPEATYPLTWPASTSDPEAAADSVAELLPEQAVLLLGPGIGRSDAIDRFVRRLLPANAGQERPIPAVIDADALTLAGGLARLVGADRRGQRADAARRRDGAAAGLRPGLGEIEGEAPWETARRAATRWQQAIVLKGPFTTVAEPAGGPGSTPTPNPALATAGTGDVLAGLTAGLAVAGPDPAGRRAAGRGGACAGRPARSVDQRACGRSSPRTCRPSSRDPGSARGQATPWLAPGPTDLVNDDSWR